MPTNPFSEAASPADNPFSGLDTVAPGAPSGMSEKLVDQTARMAAMALTPGDQLEQTYRQMTEMYAQHIKQYGDNELRAQAAINQQAEELKSLNQIIAGSRAVEFDPTGQLQEGARMAADQAIAEDISRRQEYALEKATLDKIQNLATQGDYTQAKILMNQVEHGTADDIINEINVKRMIIQREVEKAQIAADEQPWVRSAIDFLMSVVGDFTLNNSMDRNNLVDIDKGLKHWWDWIISGNRYRTEAATLWDMKPADFAKALREEVIPRVKDHSSFLGYQSNTQVLNLLSGLADTPKPRDINLTDSLALAGIIPFGSAGKVSSIPYLMMRSGARKEAAETLANTSLLAVRSGTQAAEKATGISADEIVENTLPSALNPSSPAHVVPATGDTIAALERGKELIRRMGEWIQSGRMTEAELQKAVQAERERLIMEIGRPLKDFKETKVNLTDGSTTTRFEFMIGKKKGGGFLTKASADREATRMGIANPEFVLAEDGQWFIKETRDLNEAGFYTTNLNPGLKHTGIVGRIFLGARQIDDELLAGQSRMAANTRNRMMKGLRNEFHNKLTNIDTIEKDYLSNAMAWGENNSVWLSRDELDELFARQGAKNPASDKAWEAYTAARDINDIEYALRNDVEWKRRATRGFETVSFDNPILSAPVTRENALIGRAAQTPPNGRVYDLETGTHYHRNNPLTPDVFKDKIDDGYVVVSLERETALKDGTTVKHFLMKKNQMQAERLRQDQLPYRAGGHRLYADKYFVKQTVWGVQPDTGEKFLKNPNTYISGTKAEVETWARTMEQARQMYKAFKGNPPIEKLDAILKEVTSLDADDFIKMMKDGRLQEDSPFVALFDRELPEDYIHATSPLDFVDVEETGFTGWLRTNGRMYYSSKGEALHDWQWERARTIDPFQTTNEALQNIANISSFSDYKMSAVERWVQTYRQFLDTGGLPHNASDLTIFAEAKYRSNVDKMPMGAGLKVKQQMEAQRDIIRRNIGWKTDFDRLTDRYMQDMVDGIMGSDPLSRRHRIGKAVTEWWGDFNPLNAARGLAFDMKMGLFNIAQFPLQIQTMLATTALGGVERAVPAMVNIPMMRIYLTKAGTEEFLEMAVKRGMNELAGMSPEEYKQMMRAAKTSGFFEFGGSHQLVNSQGPSAVVGGFRDGWDKFTRAGRFFFNEGEMWNRMTAWQVAWKEQLGDNLAGVPMLGGRVRKVGPDFLRQVALRADDYSMNMMQQSGAAWQSGLASIPTQFWAYQARMLEALLGKQFTLAQKTRLLIAQTFFYGAAGAPLMSVPMALAKNARGEPFELNTPMGFLDRGMIDHVIWNMFGADILAGKRYGTGSWLSDMIGEMFNLSPYGEKSAVEIFGGATFSILGQSGDTLFDLVRHITAESGQEDYPLTKEDWLRLAKNVSSFSYAHKAYMVHQYGLLVTNKGTVVAGDIPSADTMWVALGMQPGEQDEISAAIGYLKNKKKAVDEASKYISDKRTLMVEQPDQRNEIAAEVNAYMRLLPPDIRRAALKEANRRTPRTLHEGLARQMEKEKAQREAMKNGQTN